MPELLDVVVPKTIALDVVLEVNGEETPMPKELKLVRGDTTTIRCTVRDLLGVVVDITGATPTLRIRKKGETAVRLTTTGSVVAPGTNGIFDVARAATDYDAGKIDAAGNYEGEVQITFTDGKIGSQYERIAISYVEDFD